MRRRQLRILVVEDDSVWRNQLGMMYCRILRCTSHAGRMRLVECIACSRAKDCLHRQPTDMAEDNLHPDVVLQASGSEAIRHLRTARDRYQVASIDINLGPQEGVTGMDVLDRVLQTQFSAAVIVVTASSYDTELPGQLSGEETRRVHTLHHELDELLPGAHLYHQKPAPHVWGRGLDRDEAIRRDVRVLESRLNYAKLSQMARKRESLSATERVVGLPFAIGYVLPEDYFTAFKKHPVVWIHPDNWFELNEMEVVEEIPSKSDFDLGSFLAALEQFPEIQYVFGHIDYRASGRSADFLPFPVQPSRHLLLWLRELAKQRLIDGYRAFYPGSAKSRGTVATALSRLKNHLNVHAKGTGWLMAREPVTNEVELTRDIQFVLCRQSALVVRADR